MKKQIKEESMHEDYERFSKFWEKARNIKDEDGDNFLHWDKSNIGHFSFSRGFEEGRKQALEEVEKIIDELKGDNLAYGYKAYEEKGERMSSIEICYREDCNAFVIKRIKDELKFKIKQEMEK